MAFKIINETYVDDNRKPEVFGYIEGYTSNTIGETYLRLNIKVLIDQEKIEWHKRVHGDIPKITFGFEKGVRTIQEGDIVGEGIRLNKKQVKQLIKELKKWLRKGY